MPASILVRISSFDAIKQVWQEYWKTSRKSAAGVDAVTPKDFAGNLHFNIDRLCGEMRKQYRYSNLRAIPIEKTGSDKKRIIAIPTLRDRLVQRAVLRVIEERGQTLGIVNEVSFGFVKQEGPVRRGTHAARKAALARRQQRPWALKADISAFFDKIERPQLISGFGKAFRIPSLLPLVSGAINCEIDDRYSNIRRIVAQNGIEKGLGLRQGMPLSPILSNFVLRDFDRAFRNQGVDLVRYADDFVVFAETESECKRFLAVWCGSSRTQRLRPSWRPSGRLNAYPVCLERRMRV